MKSIAWTFGSVLLTATLIFTGCDGDDGKTDDTGATGAGNDDGTGVPGGGTPGGTDDTGVTGTPGGGTPGTDDTGVTGTPGTTDDTGVTGTPGTSSDTALMAVAFYISGSFEASEGPGGPGGEPGGEPGGGEPGGPGGDTGDTGGAGPGPGGPGGPAGMAPPTGGFLGSRGIVSYGVAGGYVDFENNYCVWAAETSTPGMPLDCPTCEFAFDVSFDTPVEAGDSCDDVEAVLSPYGYTGPEVFVSDIAVGFIKSGSGTTSTGFEYDYGAAAFYIGYPYYYWYTSYYYNAFSYENYYDANLTDFYAYDGYYAIAFTP